MPPGSSPVCVWCQATSTTMWHRLPNNQIVCQICYAKRNLQNTGDSPTDTSTNKRNTNSGATNSGKGNSRDKGNGGSGRTRSQGQTKTSLLSRRGRRSLKKRKPMKAPSAKASIVTCSKVFHQGIKYQVGDIVSLVDIQCGLFFAQIRGFMQDQYGEKSVVLTWLLPTQPCPDHFDPSIFVLGPEEDVCRPMDCIEFVCHSPPKFSAALPTPYAAYAPLVQQSNAIASLLAAAEQIDKSQSP